jgi:hypothetical protein
VGDPCAQAVQTTHSPSAGNVLLPRSPKRPPTHTHTALGKEGGEGGGEGGAGVATLTSLSR